MAIPQTQVFGPVGGQIPSGVALTRVDLNVVDFNASLTRYIQLLGIDTVDTVKSQALDLLKRIQLKTPRDTHRLVRSFHAVLPGQVDSSFPYTDKSGKAFDGALHVSPKNGPDVVEAAVGTNVKYGPVIEAGHSRQAPNGMVAISVAEMTGQLDAAMTTAIIAAWMKTP